MKRLTLTGIIIGTAVLTVAIGVHLTKRLR